METTCQQADIGTCVVPPRVKHLLPWWGFGFCKASLRIWDRLSEQAERIFDQDQSRPIRFHVPMLNLLLLYFAKMNLLTAQRILVLFSSRGMDCDRLWKQSLNSLTQVSLATCLHFKAFRCRYADQTERCSCFERLHTWSLNVQEVFECQGCCSELRQ